MIPDGPLRRLLQAEADFQAVRAQGPGGQNVNKVSSAAQLRFDIRASSLPDGVKARLLNEADQRISADGVIVIKAQRHRSLTLNRAEALQRLTELVQAAQQVPRTRHATRPTRASVQRRLQGKNQRGQLKAQRGAKADAD
ncbi:MAG: alternative ribosome rescue aminoacyl-tRNA hydrolase ArfB [Burkholderiaceae bacterium]